MLARQTDGHNGDRCNAEQSFPSWCEAITLMIAAQKGQTIALWQMIHHLPARRYCAGACHKSNIIQLKIKKVNEPNVQIN